MSRNYKFHNPEGLYFVSFAVVSWLDVLQETDIRIMGSQEVIKEGL